MRDTSPKVHEIKLTLLEEHFITKRLSNVKQISKDTLNLSKILNQHIINPKQPIHLNRSELSSFKSAQALIAAQLVRMSYMEVFWLKVRIKLSKKMNEQTEKKINKNKVALTK